MHVWRIARGIYDPIDDERARRAGGRWNPVGTPVAYTSAHLSLAALELLVHVDVEDVPEGLVAFEVEVPEALLIETVAVEDLPAGWDEATTPPACQEIGRQWAEGLSSPVLKVPSAVMPREANYLVNPAHPNASSVEVTSQASFFDERLPGFRAQ